MFKNVPVSRILKRFWEHFGLADYPWIYDETGIEGNIDISFYNVDVLPTYADFRKAFQANGLDLVKGEKPMLVIVIRDPEN